MESQNKDKNTLRVSSLYKSFGKKSVVKGVDFSMGKFLDFWDQTELEKPQLFI